MNLQSTKRILKRIFFLPPIPTLLIAIPSYALVIYALTDETVNSAIAYISYLLSAYAFIISITGITGVVRIVRKGISQNPLERKITGIPLVSKYLTEDLFRAKTALLTQFGAADDAEFRQLMTASTGAGVCIIVSGMAVYMIAHATKCLGSEERKSSP